MSLHRTLHGVPASIVSLLLLLCPWSLGGCTTRGEERQLPGVLSDGAVLLPNGWMLSPAGTSVELGDLPLGMDVSPDGGFAVAVNAGFRGNTLSVIDLAARKVVQTVDLGRCFNGVRFGPSGDRFYVTGGNDNNLKMFTLRGGVAEGAGRIALGKPFPYARISPTGLDVDRDGSRAFVVTKEDDSVYRVDLASGKVTGALRIGDPLYTFLLDAGRRRLYVSVWGGAKVAVVDPEKLRVETLIPVDEHPTEMVLTPDGRRLFVANANSNTVSVIDLSLGKVTETISTAILPDAPIGSTPNSVALGDGGRTLYVANADNNYLAVIDISEEGRSRSRGFIPVGWYPTVVRCVKGTLLVANGKGGGSRANPKGEYIPGMFTGTLSFVAEPDDKTLADLTARVYKNTPATRDTAPSVRAADNPVPAAPGGASPIKHVFYIIKENRTYDQLFGDLGKGNGDKDLCLFGAKVTPNHHALAEEFVLFDNFYVDAEVTADGQNWSTAAYANDYVEKTWPEYYSRRGRRYDFEEDGMARPGGGYLWDNCLAHGVTIRNYGNFVSVKDGFRINAKGLRRNTCREFRGWDLSYPDVKRAEAWRAEFDEFEKNGNLPAFQIIRLPGDHTKGTMKGFRTPRAYLGDNDQALGMVVERISRSRYWKESAVFVLEDDSQYGPDHVDAHRSILLVASPWVRRGFADHTMYSTSGVLRTMELILGLPPMSQFDAAATPLWAAFQGVPDATPYRLRPAQVDLEEMNPPGAWGQEESGKMDLSREDAIPEAEFNEIIWKSVKGAASPMPPPVRSAFVRVRAERGNVDD